MKISCLLVVFAVSLVLAEKISITIPGHIPHPKDDMYQCTSHKAPEELSHIVHFEPKKANYVNGAVHHMLVYGCEAPYREGHWACDSTPTCNGDSFLVYAWAKKAPGLTLPKGAGFVVGGNTKLKYFVVQQHFLRAQPNGLPNPTGLSMLTKKGLPEKFAGMMVLAVDNFRIPAHRKKTAVKLGCSFQAKSPIDLLAYRTHAHDIGKSIIGTHNNKEIVHHSPQIPQQFNEFGSSIRVKRGDKLSVQCNYDSAKRGRVTHVGPTHLDEMCNLYYMYISEQPALSKFDCGGADGDTNNPMTSTIEVLHKKRVHAGDDFIEDEETTEEPSSEEDAFLEANGEF